MKNIIPAVLGLLLLFISGGCETANRSSRERNVRAYESARLQEEQLNRLSARVRQLENNNAQLVENLNRLTRKMPEISRQNQLLSERINKLNGALDAEKKARQSDYDKLLKEVARETAGMIKTYGRSSGGGSSGSPGPPSGGEYYEYKVEPGATLSTIAKAYGVSVSEIKRANRLESDLIRIGQVLYIPKK